MTESEFSHDKLVPLVREILEGEDLATMTPKIVRERLLKSLGNPVISDNVAFKGFVKSALQEILSTRNQKEDCSEVGPGQIEQPEQPEKPEQTGKVPISASKETAPEAAKKIPISISGETKLGDTKKVMAKEETGKTDTTLPMKRARPPYSSESNQKANGTDEDEKDDSNSDAMMSSDDERGRKQVKRKRRRGSDKTTAKSAKSSLPEDKTLDRLNAALRELGLRMPTRQLQGKTPSQKCKIILEFLRTKNIHSDPTLLSKRELAKHRKRIETEKELLDIDTRYVMDLMF